VISVAVLAFLYSGVPPNINAASCLPPNGLKTQLGLRSSWKEKVSSRARILTKIAQHLFDFDIMQFFGTNHRARELFEIDAGILDNVKELFIHIQSIFFMR
jgi:hypothetical protein